MTTHSPHNFGVSSDLEDPRPAAFFRVAHQAFREAEQSAGESVDCFYEVAGLRIHLRFAGSALVSQLTPALAHLAVPPCEPDLTICLWDSASTGTKMVSPPWAQDRYVVRSEVRGYNDERIHTAFDLWSGVLSMMDRKHDLGLFWTRDASQLPAYERGAPLRTILHWWMGQHGCQFVHAGAVGTDRGGVLLVGRGGSGKSTTSVVCLDSELRYASDDYCLLAPEPAPHIHSLYNSAKLDVTHMRQALPHLERIISNPEEMEAEKALFFFHQHCPEKIATSFPAKAILMPRVTHRKETELVRISPMAALKALAPSTIFQLSGAGKEAFQTMAEFVKQVPCHRLDVGTDLERIPPAILGFLEQT